MSNENIIFLVEGKTETIILKCLNVLGKTLEFNIWEHRATSLVRKLSNRDKVQLYLVYDADLRRDASKVKRFKDNVKRIRQTSHIDFIGVLQQTEHLEDELLRACAKIKNAKSLRDEFKAKGVDDLKSKIIDSGKNTEALRAKLREIGLDENTLWTKPLITELTEFKLLSKSFKDLTLR